MFWDLFFLILFALVSVGLIMVTWGAVKLARCARIWQRNTRRDSWPDTPDESRDDLIRKAHGEALPGRVTQGPELVQGCAVGGLLGVRHGWLRGSVPFPRAYRTGRLPPDWMPGVGARDWRRR